MLIAAGLLLKEQTADFLLEGLSRRMPSWFDKLTELRSLCVRGPLLVLLFSCDRASPSFKACAWIWQQLAKPSVGRQILPHLEPCALHAVQLVKCRPGAGCSAVATLSTLSGLMRQWRFSSALRDGIITHVKSRLRIAREPRPEVDRLRARSVLKALQMGDDQEWLYRRDASGERVPSRTLQDLEAVAAAVAFGSTEEDVIYHYCFVAEGSVEQEAGMPVAGPCCASFEGQSRRPQYRSSIGSSIGLGASRLRARGRTQ